MARHRKKDLSPPPATDMRWLGYILIVAAMFPLLSLLSFDAADIPLLQSPPNRPPSNLIGIAGAWGAFVSYFMFGYVAWLLPVFMFTFSLRIAAGRNWRALRWLGWWLLLLFACSAFSQLWGAEEYVGWRNRPQDMGLYKNPGGAVGWLIMSLGLKRVLGAVGGGLVVLALGLAAFVMLAGARNIGNVFLGLRDRLRDWRLARADQAERLAIEERNLARQLERERRAAERAAKQEEREQLRRAKQERLDERQRAHLERKEQLRREREAEKALRTKDTSAPPPPANVADEEDIADQVDAVTDAPSAPPPYQLPSLELLTPQPKGAAVHGDVTRRAETIVSTLADFNISVEVTHIVKGPVVTSFELLPAPGIRVERIAAMAKNLEMVLKATSVRVEAPIPGKGVVGVEMPNEKASPVTVREIIESPYWEECCAKMELPALLGKDVGGRDLVIDLTSMPHLLVAGATNSGKSVCINAILTGLLMSRPPAELRLMLIDPKIVEFSIYNELPHLVSPVITDPKKVALGLRWAIQEMEKRYKMLNLAGVRNISSYNRRQTVVQADLFGEGEGAEDASASAELPARLPYILIVIDELADLMLQAGPEIENGIARLAQLSRAVGIHLLIATQRPSVNVITGTIKANFPGRIAFQVAQKVDSRTILDGMGAESLIGKGDMLFLNPRTSKMVRAQGAYIGDADAKRVVDFICGQARPSYMRDVQDSLEGAVGGGSGGGGLPAEEDDAQEDEYYEAALELIKRTRRASTSSLQRALRIGYNRAGRLMDILEEKGVVGPPRGSEPREILIDFDNEIPNNTPLPDDESGGNADI